MLSADLRILFYPSMHDSLRAIREPLAPLFLLSEAQNFTTCISYLLIGISDKGVQKSEGRLGWAHRPFLDNIFIFLPLVLRLLLEIKE